jgi:putative tryptophan/tyrosine transport system substrate-binding protein
MKRREIITLLCGAAMWPLVARAQQKTKPVIGYLGAGSPSPSAPFVAAFHQGLGASGYVEGQNVAIEYRFAEGRDDQLPVLAADLVGRKVDVIVTFGGPAPRAAKAASQTIPIVFAIGGDPIAIGLVASLARPGGNVTGVSWLGGELTSKRLELVSELVPHARTIALLLNPNNPQTGMVREMQDAARAKGVQLPIVYAGSENEIDAAFASLAQGGADALVVTAEPFINSRRQQIVALAARHAVPAIYGIREYVVAGGLISYGASLAAAYRQVGIYAGTILKGAKPADLPVQQAAIFELVVNLNTAKALGLTVPPSILGRADEVIE